MPELPEVQSFVNNLNKMYAGATLERILLRRADLRFPFDKPALQKIFSRGTCLTAFQRSGKQLLIITECGQVSVSLGMSGSFINAAARKPVLHEHVTLVFSDGRALGYVDPRRFGFWLIPDEKKAVASDPTRENDLLSLFACPTVQQKKCSIKDFLMDQRFIGGVGNIYAIEALFRAKVHPLRACQSLEQKEWRRLAKELPLVLNEAIEKGGSTIATYRGLHGESGGFQDCHRIYGRTGEPCRARNCKGTIARIIQGGRSSWFCPKCQLA